MRIAHLVDSLDCGGAEQVAASLAVYQANNQHAVRIICLRDLGPFPVDTAVLRQAGVEIITLNKPDGFQFSALKDLTRVLKRGTTQVLHTHNHIVHHYGAVAGRLAGVPVIVNTLHGSSSLRMASWAKALFWFSCMLSDRCISVCRDVYDVFRAKYRLPRKVYEIVENGIDLSRYLAISRSPDGKLVTFGTIGRLDAVKDHANLLEAFASVRRKYPHVQLRLLGDGGLRADLERQAKALAIDDSVTFEGFNIDTPGFLKRIDIYVISSRSEGLPLSLLEAMGSGCPVVSTRVGSVPEIINAANGGWLCPPNNAGKLADAMIQAIEHPERSAMGLRNREVAASRYSVERMARDYDKIYRDILRE